MAQPTHSPSARRNSRVRAAHNNRNGHQLGRQAGVVAHDIQDLGGVMRDVAREKLGHMRQIASDYSGQGRKKAVKIEQNFAESIRENPIRSMLIAAGVGLLVGRFWMGR